MLGDLVGAGAEPVRRVLRDYADQRRDRTAAVQALSRDSIRLWHAAGDAASARNTALSAMTPEQLHDAVAWMHAARQRGRRPSEHVR